RDGRVLPRDRVPAPPAMDRDGVPADPDDRRDPVHPPRDHVDLRTVVHRPRTHAHRGVARPPPRVRVLQLDGAPGAAGPRGRSVLNETVVNRGFGLARLDLRQRFETFWMMARKTLLEYSRYPIAFGAIFAQIFAGLSITVLMCLGGLAVVSAVAGGLPAHEIGKGLLALLLTTSGFLGLGFVFAGVTIKLKETAQLLVNGLQFFFMIFSAMFFPFSALRNVSPAIVTYVSGVLPVSYCVDLFRSALLGSPQPELADWWVEWIIVLLFGILSPIVG